MSVYYNEIDPFAAAWLRELIKGGHIAAGEVDTRSIEDVRPDDLRGFDQCHFFAGIGGWSLALRRAGWPDDRPVWTGSCPCQPFSTAGQGAGFDDERHLWPSFHWLIQECRPAVIAGEQVASKDADPWLDLVQDDLEAAGYAFGAVAFPSAGVGAPHIRDRTYWMAHSNNTGLERRTGVRKCADQCIAGAHGVVGRMAHADRKRRTAIFGQSGGGLDCGHDQQRSFAGSGLGRETGGLADPTCIGRDKSRLHAPQGSGAHGDGQKPEFGPDIQADATGPTNGFWRDADWLFCRDGKWRPVEPGTFPLAHGIPARVGRLRGYGNAINAEQAALFVKVMAESMQQLTNK